MYLWLDMIFENLTKGLKDNNDNNHNNIVAIKTSKKENSIFRITKCSSVMTDQAIQKESMWYSH